MKIYVVMQHHIEHNVTCVSAVFTKLEDAQDFKDWYSEDDDKRVYYIMEKELFDHFDETILFAEQTRIILTNQTGD